MPISGWLKTRNRVAHVQHLPWFIVIIGRAVPLSYPLKYSSEPAGEVFLLIFSILRSDWFFSLHIKARRDGVSGWYWNYEAGTHNVVCLISFTMHHKFTIVYLGPMSGVGGVRNSFEIAILGFAFIITESIKLGFFVAIWSFDNVFGQINFFVKKFQSD